MIDQLMAYSVRNKFVIGVMVLALIGWGIYSLNNLPVDAIPDITNNQVQVLTTSPNLATLEVEQFITTPVERALQHLPGVVEVRSISRFGLSVVTVVFREDMGTYLPRQLVGEQLAEARSQIPEGLGDPFLAPISTGLGEIYQYVVRAQEGYEDRYSAMELRNVQDWIIRPQLAGIPGVIEVNTLGGLLQQYEVAIDPERLRATNVTLTEILSALEQSNENTGGAYIEKSTSTYFIRTEGMVDDLQDIARIVVKTVKGIPVLIGDVAQVRLGSAPRYGATTINAEGEVVGGIVLMLKGENSAKVTRRVEERIEQIRKSLPEGVEIEPFLVRNDLVQRSIRTVTTNLIEGGLIVIFILVLLLGNWRAGLIVASVIPLSLLFALGMMNVFGLSANLMSLGAIDFGLIVDGAVIIIEAIVYRLHMRRAGQQLSQAEMDNEVLTGAVRIRRSAAFGEIIILIVYLPILALTGIEGKMFRPMALTVGFAITGALILSLTYVPMMAALFLNKNIVNKTTWADRIMAFFQRLYRPVIRLALRAKVAVVLAVVLLFAFSLWIFSRLGGEFIPTLEEGDLALHQILPPGSSLDQSVAVSALLQKELMDHFPEVEKVVTKIGSAEVPTDPMPIETGDIIVLLKPKSEWTSATTRQELFEEMEAVMQTIPGISYEFSQPIQMRFNELMTGSRGDIAVKIYGEDLDLLFRKAQEAESLIRNIDGISSIRVEQVTGMPQIIIRYNYAKLAQYGLQVRDVNRIIRTAFAGETVSTVYEGERRYDLVVRLQGAFREDIADVRTLYIPLDNGQQVPLSEVAEVSLEEAPMQISRDNARRRIVISVNAGSQDTQTLVEEMQAILDQNLELPPGYYITYGGQFENYIQARNRLLIVVPMALFLIFVLLYLTFGSVMQAVLIFTAIPLSAIGGIWALWLRGMPFSISAGVGFIALFGVAVLNGIVLIAYFNQLEKEGVTDIRERILRGTRVRLRPVILTAAVASLGFLPMALSTSGGAEVQRPLATVVIGGLISATLLTLIILPILYSWLARWQQRRADRRLLLILLIGIGIGGATPLKAQDRTITMKQAMERAQELYPALRANELEVQQQQLLQGTAAILPPTNIFYNGDALGRGGNFAEHSFGVQQTVPLPRTFRARNELQDAQLELAQQQRGLTERELQQTIALLYVNWLALEAGNDLYQEFDSLYARIEEVARLRVQTGAAGTLEYISLQNKHAVIRLALRQNEAALRQQVEQLQLFLQWEGELQAQEDHLIRLPLLVPRPVIADTLTDHPDLAYYRRLEQVAQARAEVQKTSLLPSLTLGYASQIFGGIGGLHGVRLGINLPLSRGHLRRRIEAAGVQQQIVQAQLDSRRLRLQARRAEWWQQLQRQQEALSFFDEQGEQYATEIVRIASLNYQLGEIDYVAYVQALDQVLSLRLQYLQSLKAYNEAVVQLNYLTAY